MSAVVATASRSVYAAVRAVFRFFTNLLFQAQVQGVEHVPRQGAFLVVVNHLSLTDPALIMVYCPRQFVVFAADKWRRVPGIRHLVDAVGGIWVARGEADLSAIKQAVAMLRAGWALGMAPEGTRSKTQALQAGKSGAAYLASRTGVPIVPVALAGTERLSTNLRRLRRTPVRMVIGRPFRLPALARAHGEQLDRYTDEIMCRLAALLPPEYRGVYADHPRLRELLDAPDAA